MRGIPTIHSTSRRVLLGAMLLLFVIQVASVFYPTRGADGTIQVELCGSGGFVTLSLSDDDDVADAGHGSAHMAKCPFCVIAIAYICETPVFARHDLVPAIANHRLCAVARPSAHPAISRTIRGPPLTA